MTLNTWTLPVLTIIGASATVFWVIGFVWEPWADDLSSGGVVVFAVSILILISLAVFVLGWQFPGFLAVDDAIDWIVVLRRLVIASVVSYVALGFVLWAVGSVVIAAWGDPSHWESALFVGLFSLWFPIWVIPFSCSVIVWWWCHRDLQARQFDVTKW